MTDLTGRAHVLADAVPRGLEIEVVERPAADSLERAAELLGLETRQIVKSLVVRRHTPEGAPNEYLFVLIPGDRQISWARLRAVVGVNTLSLPSPEIACEATGFTCGTITPLGCTLAWPVFADASMVGGRIAMGAGESGYSAFVEADDLIAAYGATVAVISG